MNSGLHPPVMILGCGRSGTSIFGEIFEHLPMYLYRSEPPFSDVMNADFSVPLAFKVPYEDAAFEANPGLSFPLAAMQKCAPDMKFFWIVRHPLDAICSLRIGIAQNWGHHPKPPDWEKWLGRPLIDQCAHHWAFLNTFGLEQVSEIATIVRFEEMIADPSAIAETVCEVLGLNFLKFNVTLAEWAGRVQDTNNDDFIEAKTSRAYSRTDHSVRVGRWRENLSMTEVNSVLPIVAEAGKAFGYRFTDV